MNNPIKVTIANHLGRPMVHINGVPDPLPAYSPVAGRRFEMYKEQSSRFFTHHLNAYFITLPSATDQNDWIASPYWVGDEISSKPITQMSATLDEMVQHILVGDPDANIIIRFGPGEPKSWRDLHEDQLFVTECGDMLPTPSLASELYNVDSARFSKAVVEHCESHPWADRIIGYWNGCRVEGTHEPLIDGWLFDHSQLMTSRWREYLRGKYQTDAALQEAFNDSSITINTVAVPIDKLRGNADLSGQLYWQAAKDNQPLRDYLLLTRDLFFAQFRSLALAMHEATANSTRKPVLMYDALKQSMLGWSNYGFFDAKLSWQLYYPEMMSGSGHMDVTELFNAPGFDAIITPHDYQARGLGGIYEPEGMADSCVLRGKPFFCEMDTRTYMGTDPNSPALNDKEFAAITWRNIATGMSRGFYSYWMDVYQDWFASKGIHDVISQQTKVIRESVNWPHQTMPGIAMILDDEAVLETNGNGNVMNEQIMWEEKMGLARCGVPYRIYQFNDIKLDNFPQHRVYYFPNLYRVDDERLQLLKEKIFRDGNVVVWGPGSGISDGKVIGPESATRLTGFDFEFLPVNYPRRVLVSNFDHPITKNLRDDTFIGGPLAYGPVLHPKGGIPLAVAWTKQGKSLYGLAVKEFENWSSVFTCATPIPADLWRGFAQFAGAHVYTESNDVLIADSTIIALHSLRSGEKKISLPGPSDVYDVINGVKIADNVASFTFNMDAPQTRVFRRE
jgi:hypothetical protein